MSEPGFDGKAENIVAIYSAEVAGAGDPYEGTQRIIDAVAKQL